MRSIIKLINLFALLGSVAWLSRDVTWGPAVAFLGLLASFLAQEVLPTIKKNNKEDKKLGGLFLRQFSSTGKSCIFLKEHELHNPFHSSQLDELENFLREWNNTEHEFLNKKLEKIKKKLLNKINNFTNLLSLSVKAHEQDVNILTTKLSYVGSDIEKHEKENDLKIDKLHKMAIDIYNDHQKLTKKIKKLLNT